MPYLPEPVADQGPRARVIVTADKAVSHPTAEGALPQHVPGEQSSPRPSARPRWSPSRRPPPPGAISPSSSAAPRNVGLEDSTTPSSSGTGERSRPVSASSARSPTFGADAQTRPALALSEHVYNQGRGANGAAGARAALCVEAVLDRHGRPTIKFEGASSHPALANRYDWENKVIFFVEPDELQALLCVLLGYLDSENFSNHGPSKSKFLTLKRQTDSFYCTIGEGRDRTVAINIPVGSATRIALLLFRQFQLASFGLEASALNLVLARVAAPLAKAAAAGGTTA